MVALEEGGRRGRLDYWLDYGFGEVAHVKINQKPLVHPRKNRRLHCHSIKWEHIVCWCSSVVNCASRGGKPGCLIGALLGHSFSFKQSDLIFFGLSSVWNYGLHHQLHSDLILRSSGGYCLRRRLRQQWPWITMDQPSWQFGSYRTEEHWGMKGRSQREARTGTALLMQSGTWYDADRRWVLKILSGVKATVWRNLQMFLSPLKKLLCLVENTLEVVPASLCFVVTANPIRYESFH